MTLTTSQNRADKAPACKAHLHLVDAYTALDAVLKQHAYAPRAGVTGSYNCRKITGGTGYSLHSYLDGALFTFWSGVRVSMALAVDINWDRNPYGKRLISDMPRAMVEAILAITTNSGDRVWGWGGNYSGNKDAMHFEVVCSKAALATGIRGGITTPTVPPPPPAQVTPASDFERERIRQLQRHVGATPDGIWGPETEKDINGNLVGWDDYVRAHSGYKGPLRGNNGKRDETVAYLQFQGNRKFKLGLKNDGECGPATNHLIVVGLGQADGIAGPKAWREALR